eukprot:XP_001701176.1 predicted protein [Chlamydomonas reinhardtii]
MPSPAAPRAGLAHFNHRTWCYGWGLKCSGRRLHGPAPCRGVSHTIIEELVDSPRSPFHSLGLAEHQKAGGYERAARRQVAQLRRLKADPGSLALDPSRRPDRHPSCMRREALVGGSELVEQLAAALEPGALVWIQSDVLSTAATFRRLFWRHGGFAPSARHAAARSVTRTREWLRPDATGDASGSPSGPATGTGAAIFLDEGRSADDAAGAGAGFSGMALGRLPAAPLLPSRPQSQPPWPLQLHSELQPHSGLQPSQRLPLLLTGTDLATHAEPWLTGQQTLDSQLCCSF